MCDVRSAVWCLDGRSYLFLCHLCVKYRTVSLVFFPQLFHFYANLFSACQQLNTSAAKATFADTMLANRTLCFGESLFLFRDLGLYPHLVSREELQHVFDHLAQPALGDCPSNSLSLSRCAYMLLCCRGCRGCRAVVLSWLPWLLCCCALVAVMLL